MVALAKARPGLGETQVALALAAFGPARGPRAPRSSPRSSPSATPAGSSPTRSRDASGRPSGSTRHSSSWRALPPSVSDWPSGSGRPQSPAPSRTPTRTSRQTTRTCASTRTGSSSTICTADGRDPVTGSPGPARRVGGSLAFSCPNAGAGLPPADATPAARGMPNAHAESAVIAGFSYLATAHAKAGRASIRSRWARMRASVTGKFALAAQRMQWARSRSGIVTVSPMRKGASPSASPRRP